MQGYHEWADRHCRAFGLRDPDDLLMILEWQLPFEQMGFTAEELQEATTYLIANNPPRFRTDHTRFIRDRIVNRRLAKAEEARSLDATQIAQLADRGECVTCFNSGIATVPHPISVVDGRWLKRLTLGVVCHCAIGRTLAIRDVQAHAQTKEAAQKAPKENSHVHKIRLTLEEYNDRNGNWRHQVAERDRQDELERRAQERVDRRGSLAGSVDAVLGKVKGAAQ